MYWPTLSCLFLYLLGRITWYSDTRWSIASLYWSRIQHLGSAPFILVSQFLLKRLWSCTAMMNPSVSAFRPTLHICWWVFALSASACWLHQGYHLCKALFSQVCFTCLIPSFLVFLFIFLSVLYRMLFHLSHLKYQVLVVIFCFVLILSELSFYYHVELLIEESNHLLFLRTSGVTLLSYKGNFYFHNHSSTTIAPQNIKLVTVSLLMMHSPGCQKLLYFCILLLDIWYSAILKQ